MFDWFNRKTQQVVEAVKTTWKFVEKPSTLLVILAQLYMGGFYYYLGTRAAASTSYGAFLVGYPMSFGAAAAAHRINVLQTVRPRPFLRNIRASLRQQEA